MKKLIVKLLAAAMAVSLLAAGCGSTDGSKNADAGKSADESGNSESADGREAGSAVSTETGVDRYYNETYGDQMVTFSGETVYSEDACMIGENAGIAIMSPAAWEKLNTKRGIQIEDDTPYAFLGYYMPSGGWALIDDLTEDSAEDEQEDAYNQAFDMVQILFAVYRVNSDDQDSRNWGDQLKEWFDTTEELLTIGEDTFYLSYDAEISADDLSSMGYTQGDMDDVAALQGTMEDLKNNLIFFPPVETTGSDSGIDMSEFTAADMDGNTVDASVFADYDVTMVNVWATWCQYCVEEMPGIEKLYEGKADNVNIITICEDAASEHELAVSELEQVGATFMTLQGNEELEDKVIAELDGFPTTFFVDRQGNVLETIQVGAPATDEDQVVSAYTELINQALKEIQ